MNYSIIHRTPCFFSTLFYFAISNIILSYKHGGKLLPNPKNIKAFPCSQLSIQFYTSLGPTTQITFILMSSFFVYNSLKTPSKICPITPFRKMSFSCIYKKILWIPQNHNCFRSLGLFNQLLVHLFQKIT